MTLLVYQNTDFDIKDLEKIIIILSIETVKIKKLEGQKGDTIKDIIKNSDIIKIDFKWCIFKYNENEIDINKKFDDIAIDEDKKKLKIELTVNYTIPLIVNIINEKKESTSIQCLLKDRVSNKIHSYFSINQIDLNDYYLIYNNEKFDYFDYVNNEMFYDNFYNKIFYAIIPEDKIQNSITNEKINNNKDYLVSNDNLEKTNKILNYTKEKISDMTLKVFPNNETDERKIEIEIRVIKKCLCVRLKNKFIIFEEYQQVISIKSAVIFIYIILFIYYWDDGLF